MLVVRASTARLGLESHMLTYDYIYRIIVQRIIQVRVVVIIILHLNLIVGIVVVVVAILIILILVVMQVVVTARVVLSIFDKLLVDDVEEEAYGHDQSLQVDLTRGEYDEHLDEKEVGKRLDEYDRYNVHDPGEAHDDGELEEQVACVCGRLRRHVF